MEGINLTRGINYMWNDVAGLLDETSSFFISKTMIKLPGDKPSIREIFNHEVLAFSKDIEVNNQGISLLKGVMVFQITYLGEETGVDEEIIFEIPYEGNIGNGLDRSVTPEIQYVNCQAVGLDNVLIEIVVGLGGTENLARSTRSIVEHFGQDRYIVLPEEWPGVEKLISMQVQHTIEESEVISPIEVRITGVQEVKMLYVGDNHQGDKVILHRENYPFQRIMSLDSDAVSDGDLQIINEMITAQIMDSRGVVLDGKFAVATQGSQYRAAVESLAIEEVIGVEEVLAEGEEAMKEDLANRFEPYLYEEAEVVVDETTEDEVVEEVVETAEVEMVPEEVAPQVAESREEVIEEESAEFEAKSNRPARQSRRDRLTKHMRSLDAGVSTTNSRRNR